MSVRSAQAIAVEFITSSPTTQAATNADSLPTGILIVSGVDNAATVTVTNVTTGRYKASFTLPTLAIGDVVELVILATVATIAGKAIVWRDTKDVLLDASGQTTFANTSIATVTTVTTTTNLTNLPSVPTDWLTAAGVKADAVTKIQAGLSTYAGGDTAGTTTLLARLTAIRAGLMDNLVGIDATVSSRSTYAGGAVASVTGAVGSVTSTVNATLVSTGLDAIATTAPTGPATTFREMMVQVWRRYFKKSAKAVSGLTVKTYADDGTTVITTQTYADDGAGNETLGAAS